MLSAKKFSLLIFRKLLEIGGKNLSSKNFIFHAKYRTQHVTIYKNVKSTKDIMHNYNKTEFIYL
jgi:hypothetical protein